MLEWLLPIGGAVLGAIQGNDNAEKAKKQNLLDAEKMRMSPWFGMQGDGQLTQPDSMIGNIAGGALSGYSQAREFGKQSAWDDLMKKWGGSADGAAGGRNIRGIKE